ALLAHAALDGRDLVLVDEHLQVAGIGEIDLRGEESHRAYAVVAFLREEGESGGKQRAAHAVPDRVDLLFAGRGFDRVEPVLQALPYVGFPALCPVTLIRIDPGYVEDGVPLGDSPADEGFFRIEVEDVVLVDPGRADEERPFEDSLGRWIVLDDFG